MGLCYKIFREIDTLGIPISFKHKGFSSSKTLIGAFMSIIFFTFCGFVTLYLGRDIVDKQKPIARFSKDMRTTSEISLFYFPFSVVITDGFKNPIPGLDSLVTMTAWYYDLSNATLIYKLYFERCDPRQYYTYLYETLFHNTPPLPIDTFCLNSTKMRLTDNNYDDIGPIINQNFTIVNEYASMGSKYVSIHIDLCDEIRDNKTCANEDDMIKNLSEFYVTFAFIDNYVSLQDFAQPQKPYVNSYTQMVNIGDSKRNYFRFKNTEITTDKGYILEDTELVSFYQMDSYRTDVSTQASNLYHFTVEGTRLVDTYDRKYVKIQDILSNIGGFFKFLMVIGQLLCFKYSELVMYFSISNQMFNYDLNTQENTATKITGVVHGWEGGGINMTHNQTKTVIMETNQKKILSNDVNRVKKRFSFINYIKALTCQRKNTKKYDIYSKCVNIIDSYMEITNQMKNMIKVDKIIDMVSGVKDSKEFFNYKIDINDVCLEKEWVIAVEKSFLNFEKSSDKLLKINIDKVKNLKDNK